MLSEVFMITKEWQEQYLNGMTAQEWIDYSRRIEWLFNPKPFESDS